MPQRLAEFSSVAELIEQRASSEAIAFTYLDDGIGPANSLTFRELFERSAGVAAVLRREKIARPGDRALLIYPSGLDFIPAFFGCLLAGVIAVPLSPVRRNQAAGRLRAIAKNAGARAILTTSRMSVSIKEHLDDAGAVFRLLATEALDPASDIPRPRIEPETIALLQYTSGSTGAPKGVVVSHANILHNQRTIARACGHSERTIFAGWLPLFHDMGLMGNVLQPVFLGIHSVLFSTNSFLASPAKWLRTISQYRATTSGGPNFAYDHCFEQIRPEQIEGVDLSSWSVAFNGAEPVRDATIERFALKFTSYGFRKEAFHPCYGMAEATLFITGKPLLEPPQIARVERDRLEKGHAVEGSGATVSLVSSGRAWSDESILIVQPETGEVSRDGQIGEIWVRSASVAQGYWRNASATAEVFVPIVSAKKNRAKERRYLRTGDLGFLKGGQLFVTGRLKDVMILRGRNYYPQDIEDAGVRAAAELGPGAAAFCRGERDDEPVLIVEVRRKGRPLLQDSQQAEELAGVVREAVFAAADLQIPEIVFVPAGSLPRTTSGKLRRFACRLDYLNGSLKRLWRSRAGEREGVSGVLAGMLGLAGDLPRESSLVALGVDSLQAAELQVQLRNQLGVECRIEEVLGARSIGELELLCRPFLKNEVKAPESDLPLTATQQALWFLWKSNPESCGDALCAAVRILSPSDPAAAVLAVRRLAAKHPFLATRFHEDAAGVVTQSASRGGGDLTFEHDAHLWDEDELARRVAAAASRRIDLRNDPAFRVELFSNAPGGAVLLFVAHHIIADLRSMEVLLRDFGRFYGDAPTESEPDWSFARYAQTAAAYPSSEAGRIAEEYWRKQLGGEREPWQFPADRPASAMPNARGSRLHFDVPAELAERLRRVAARQDATLHSLLVSAYFVLLHRSSGQNDITIGAPVLGRDPDCADAIGCFINVVALRNRYHGRESFVDLLERTRGSVLVAIRYQQFPPEAIRRALADSGEAAPPLWETIFSLERPRAGGTASLLLPGVDGGEMQIGGLRARAYDVPLPDVQFELSLRMVENAGQLHGCFEYRRGRFDAATVERLAGRLLELLRGIADDPSTPLHELSCFAPGERATILQHAAGERIEIPNRTIHELIEEQCRSTPDNLALEMGERSFRYRELNHAANALARRLLSRGMQPEARVAVLMERSPEALIAMLAIWKAGGIYVPVDPRQPEARWLGLLQRLRPAAVIHDGRIAGEWEAEVLVSGAVEELCATRAPDPNAGAAPEHAAYIIHTSGSSGESKGVVVSHRNAVNFALAQLRCVPVSAADRLLQLASLGFDASLSDVMMSWFSGARLCLAEEDERTPGLALERLVRGKKITMITAAASVLEAIEPENYPDLAKAISTAEACRPETVRRWGAKVALFNGYGPTETTIGATLSRCVWAGQEDSWKPPIGRPFANYQVYILDSEGSLAPLGTAGEIAIGGEGVAAGYLEDPVLTAQNYVPDPFGAAGARRYKTGDRGRLLPTGEIEYLGRIDSQIKLRGFRIEPAEIEAAIRAVCNEADCVVLDVEARPGRKQLVAYVAIHSVDERAILAELRQRLPAYMVPSRVVRIERMLRGANGKIDRRGLAANPPAAAAHPSGPRDDFEKRVARIWEEVLKAEQVGRNENFFDLGGNSLLIGAIQRRIAAEFGTEVPVTEFFLRPTVESLCDFLRGESQPEPTPMESAGPGAGNRGVAIIGMAGRFPGAENIDALWRNLCAGIESVTFFSQEELLEAGWDEATIQNPAFVPARGVISAVEEFDAAFFDMNPREAQLLDPQKRVLLECAQAALDDAGYAFDPSRGEALAAGVFAALSRNSYYRSNLVHHSELLHAVGELASSIAVDKSFAATIVSYKLNLSGPSVTVDTACSSSLVAVHQAIQSVVLGECELALAAGCSIDVPVAGGHAFEEAGIASPDGRCRPFDRGACGTVKGAGAGVVVLKRLADAMRDRDHIYAVIKGSAINNDGRRKIGYAAPSVAGQSAAIRSALQNGAVAPETIGFIEAHGTATALGDPIELTALASVFSGAPRRSVAIGSIKSNIGHLDAAAGVAGLIKAALTVYHDEVPPTLHYREPTPHFDLEHSPFYVNTEVQDLSGRRAAVSSFGIGGTNAHVVLETAPAPDRVPGIEGRPLLAVVSAASATSLRNLQSDLAARLRSAPELPAPAVSLTLSCGRRHMAYRRSYVFADVAGLAEALDSDQARVSPAPSERPHLAFVFPGQGVHTPGMAAETYRFAPAFRKTVESCLAHLGASAAKVREFLLNPESPSPDTSIAQPALFVAEYALAMFLRELGAAPDFLLGHSLGDFVAACLAGVFTVEDAVRLVAARGRLMATCPPGAMLAVALSERELRGHLVTGCSISAINSPAETIVSGDSESIERQRQKLRRSGVACLNLEGGHGFHSPLVEAIRPEFRKVIESVRLNEPSLPLLSNASGDWAAPSAAAQPDYWVDQLLAPVRFSDCAAKLLGRAAVLIEVGPRRTLADLVRRNGAFDGQRLIAPGAGRGGFAGALGALGELWESGVGIDWGCYASWLGPAGRIRLPGHRFERQRYWLDAPGAHRKEMSAREAHRSEMDAPGGARKEIDVRRAQPTEELAPCDTPDRAPAAERTAGEAEIAEIWSELLGTFDFASSDRFLDVGGGSLTALRLRETIAHRFGVQLNSADVLGNPALGELARRISDGRRPVPAPVAAPRREQAISLEQQQIWLTHKLSGEPSILNLPVMVAFEGPLDVARLSEALARLLERHPVLRTRFLEDRVRVRQEIRPAGLHGGVLQIVAAHAAEAEIRRIAREEAAQPFDLERDLLVRARLLRAAPQRHVLLFTAHHIVCDGVSLAQLVNELSTHYNSEAISPPERGYQDYIDGQAISATPELLNTQLAYWKNKLDGAPVLELRRQKTRPARIDYRSASETVEIGEAECKQIETAARKAEVTLFVFLLAAFRAALARHTDQQDVCIGTAVSTRPASHGATIGCFVNRMVIRSQGVPGQRFDEWLETMRQASAEALDYLDVPFHRIVSAIQGIAAPGCDPLCQATISLESSVPDALAFGEARASYAAYERNTTQLDLMLWIRIEAGRMLCRFEYRTAVFPEGLIRNLAADFREIAVTGAGEEAAAKDITTEAALRSIWEDVLARDGFSSSDNFFEAGGNSFAAAWVAARIEQSFGVRIDLPFLQEHPTIQGLARAIENRRNAAPEVLPALAADPEHRFDEFPLTDLQQAYWTGRSPEFEMGNVATHGYLELEADNLDPGRFRDALQALIARHDSLRIRLTPEGKQTVLPAAPQYEPELLDLRALNEDGLESELRHLREEMSAQVFDVHRWPLFEVRLTRLSATAYRIHIGIEALIADGWSAWLLLRDFNTIYSALEGGGSAALPTLPFQFRDYALAVESLKESPLYENARAYWTSRLDDLPPAPPLPLAVAPSAIGRPKFRRRRRFLSPADWQALKAKAAVASLTPAAMLVTAYAEVLAAWSNLDHFTLNLTVFNRIPFAPEVQEIVGNFSTISLLEADLRAGNDFAARARLIGAQLWRDLAHVYFSGVQVLRALGQRRGAIGRANMPVVFTSMIGAPAAIEESAGVLDPAKEVFAVGQTSQVWLDCVVAERDGGLAVIWDAVDELFPEGLLDELFDAFESLLIRLVADETAWNGAVELTPASQLARRCAEPNPQMESSGDLLHSLFHRSARMYPDRIAVTQGGVDLTYAELDRLSRALGRELRDLGASPNQLIAVWMDKGWEQVVAVLGILESGAAYLPIDASLPPLRQIQMWRQSQARIVVRQPHAELPAEVAAECRDVVMDRARLWRSEEPTDHGCRQNPGDLAYVIFTSGSTGVPKGVMIDHRGAVNTILDINRRFAVSCDDAVLALSSLSFDLSVYDIFGLLAAGGKIVIPTAMGQLEPSHWLDLMERLRVTLWNSVPALMGMMADFAAFSAGRVRSLRLALLSGDWIPVGLPASIRALAPQLDLVSLGGATEASIWSILYPIGEVPADWKSIPYGKALDNQSVLVLDSRMRPCPDWTVGELYIGGIGVARGYWGDPELSAARFILHPFTGEVLYRTGDRGRYLPDGNIEFLGRIDSQVKIAGHRIELGEIEAHLRQYPAVRDAIASVDVTAQAKRLVAYVTLRKESPADDSDTDGETAWHEMIEAASRQAADPANDIQVSPSELRLTIERMTAEYTAAVCGAFAALGLFERRGEVCSVEDALRAGVAPRYERWLRRAMRFLAEREILRWTREGFESVVSLEKASLPSSGDPELWHLLTEAEHSAQLYIRQETVEGYQKIFPLCHAVMRAAMARYAEARRGAPLRVLEVGAGHGSCTLHVLPVLPPGSEYVFTDISPLFLRNARENFQQLEFIEYKLLNLDGNPQMQGFELHSFDVVIAASVLHDTRDVCRSLDTVRSLLRSGGLLLMIEETRFYPFFDLGMGLQQGFDVFEDVQLRREHALLSREQWSTILNDRGYAEHALIRAEGSASDVLGFDVIAARGPAGVASFDPEQLTSFLADRLPRYMLPARYIVLEDLPLSANGKVDRKVLPSAGAAPLASDAEFVAPATPVEEELAGIWKDLLEREVVGRHDNFFMLGGDSLLASQLVVSVRERLGASFPMRAIFETPTIAEIAGLIEATRLSEASRLVGAAVTGAI